MLSKVRDGAQDLRWGAAEIESMSAHGDTRVPDRVRGGWAALSGCVDQMTVRHAERDAVAHKLVHVLRGRR
ncbi:MAG: hypothetical protein JWO98_5117, partial [Frankiales bacterium]|nr:hypothetical protein [Frankiales bacterium]